MSTMTICLKYLGQGAYKTYLDDDSNKDTVELLYSTFALLWTLTVLDREKLVGISCRQFQFCLKKLGGIYQCCQIG